MADVRGDCDEGSARPSASGYGNARSIAAVQSVLASGGEVRGVRVLSPTGCERVLEEQFVGEDTLLGTRARYGMGLACRDGRACGAAWVVRW